MSDLSAFRPTTDPCGSAFKLVGCPGSDPGQSRHRFPDCPASITEYHPGFLQRRGPKSTEARTAFANPGLLAGRRNLSITRMTTGSSSRKCCDRWSAHIRTTNVSADCSLRTTPWAQGSRVTRRRAQSRRPRQVGPSVAAAVSLIFEESFPCPLMLVPFGGAKGKFGWGGTPGLRGMNPALYRLRYPAIRSG